MICGLSAAGLLGREAFLELLDRCGTDRLVRARYGMDSVKAVLVGALAYGEGTLPPPAWATGRNGMGQGSVLRIARFARADWYAELTACLKSLARGIHDGLPDDHPARAFGFRQGWHCLANSRLPEKALAVAAGLGFIGRNSLLIVTRSRGAGFPSQESAGAALGPGVVLGLLLMPVDADTARNAILRLSGGAVSDPDDPAIPSGECVATRPAISANPDFPGKPGALCGSCRACVDACPTHAVLPGGGIERELCLQHWSTIPGELPDAIKRNWGERLYGCDVCLEACPWFRDSSNGRLPTRGILGPSLPTGFFLSATDSEIRTRLSRTALGLGWMPPEAFRRNAGVAAGTAGTIEATGTAGARP